MKIAIEGCCHGELDAIYSHIAHLEARNGYTVDLLLICGDFQAVRNYQDLQCMSVPNKYKQLGGFYKYYTGEAKAPILTICIGGNHEASNYFQELYHGGWIAPNIYFMGHAGVVQVNGIRIAAASGIFKGHDFRQGHFEKVPYDKSTLRSVYHIREYNVRRLSLISSPDIFLSHDWPLNIEHHGDVSRLLRNKKHFKADVAQGTLGSPPLMHLLMNLKPNWWFAAHLHTKFEATVYHEPPLGRAAPPPIHNPDEIVIDEENFSAPLKPEEEAELPAAPAATAPASFGHAETKFLALDKCLPKRGFLEVIDYPTPANQPADSTVPTISLDPEWLAITRAFHPLLSTTRFQRGFPPETEAKDMVRNELKWVMKNVVEDGKPKLLEDVQKFVMTAPGPDLGERPEFSTLPQPPWYPNPQTEAFCKTLGIVDNVGFTPQSTGSQH